MSISCTKPVLPDDDTLSQEQEIISKEDEKQEESQNQQKEKMTIKIKVNGKEIKATLVENAATAKLMEILSKGPLNYSSSDNGFETYGDIGQTLPTSNQNITAAPGDILLYSSRYICIFWGNNTYSYTRLGKIEGLSTDEIKSLFSGNQSITISK